MKHVYGPRDEADRIAATAAMTAQDGKVRVGLITPDNREHFIVFTPEEARAWAASMIRRADELEGKREPEGKSQRAVMPPRKMSA